MKRREITTLLCSAAMWPLAAHAQQKVMPTIGYLGSTPAGPAAPFVASFLQGLAEIGYVAGQNVAIEYRWADDHFDRLPALAADLVSRKVDVIVPGGGTVAALAAKGATSTIPIVFTIATDPVKNGIVRSLARPEANLTGLAFLSVELMSKRLELLCDLVPQATVIALLVNPSNPIAESTVTRSGPHEGRAAHCVEGRKSKRDRCRFRKPRPVPRRRAHCRPRSLLR